MKKKNTKSCFTWLKNIFVSYPINKGSLCLTLSMVSLVSVGFSSWMLVGESCSSVDLDVLVGDIKGLATLDSKKGSYNVCKWGFVDETDRIVSKACYSWTLSVNQQVARNSGYVNENGQLPFTVSLKDKRGTNSLIALLDKSCFSCQSSITYNSNESSAFSFVKDNDSYTSNLVLDGLTDLQEGKVTINVYFEFNSSMPSEAQQLIEKMDLSKGLSFVSIIGVEK